MHLSGPAMQQIRLIVLLLLVTIASFSQPLAPPAEAKLTSPDLDLILQPWNESGSRTLLALAPTN